jgi:hypothetical protein
LANLLRSTSEPGRKGYHFDDFCALLFCQQTSATTDLDDPSILTTGAASPTTPPNHRESGKEEKSHKSALSIGKLLLA